ncbi:MAG TPA: class I SAM-dependent methyltransferase [Galbitalea sp.]|jgi:SAM-dependent methyltransferase
MHLDAHYTDPRLAAVYDLENSGRDDIDFYLALAAEVGARDVVDLGCGTGVLAVDLAARGHSVTGIDPADAMLAIARERPGGQLVRWILGTASDLEPASVDLVVMTGHVAQVFLDDEEWAQTLRQIAGALRPGGRLAFESRNPSAEGWAGWNPVSTFATLTLPSGEAYDSWLDVTDVGAGFVSFLGHNVFSSDGRDVAVPSTLRYRALDELAASLRAAGFTLERNYGDWDRSEATPTSRELILIAARLPRAVRGDVGAVPAVTNVAVPL